MNTLSNLVAVLGILVVPAVIFLIVGDVVRARKGSGPERRFSTTVHLVAMFAALVGTVMTWMAFDSDASAKWRSLADPIVMVALVYIFAYLIGNNLGAPGTIRDDD